MCTLTTFMRCVGESPAAHGARKAYSCVPAHQDGPCTLHYERNGSAQVAQFVGYQHALTAATMALFSDEHDYRHIVICAATCSGRATAYPNAVTWRQAQA